MRLTKTGFLRLLAGAFCAAVLGLQLLAQTLGSGRLWPFVHYEMYSQAHAAGSTISHPELHALPAEPAAPARVIRNDELHMTWFVFVGLLERASGSEGDAARADATDLLGHLIARYVGPGFRRGQVWANTWEIGPGGLRSREPRQQLVHEWELTPQDGAAEPPA